MAMAACLLAVMGVPDTRLRRWFHAKMDRTFDPPHPAAIQNHCLHIHAVYLVGRLLRG